MADLPFSLATGMHERGRPLAEGKVSAQGLALRSVMMKNNGARHDRFLSGEFDGAEFSFALYLRSWSQGAAFSALPVFLNRQFRHASIFVNAAAGIAAPADLHGKRVGIMSWFNTAALWARAGLQHAGVDLRRVRWVTGEAADLASFTPPAGMELGVAPRPLLELLLAGEIDGMITPRTISRDHAPKVVRLFPDVRSVEERYYRETGIFPTSHALVVRTKLLDENPWLAGSLIAACTAAQEVAREYADDPEHSLLAWYGAQMEHELAVLGPNASAYGIEPNRKTLEAAVQIGVSLGLLPKAVPVEELFHPSARDAVGAGRA